VGCSAVLFSLARNDPNDFLPRYPTKAASASPRAVCAFCRTAAAQSPYVTCSGARAGLTVQGLGFRDVRWQATPAFVEEPSPFFGSNPAQISFSRGTTPGRFVKSGVKGN